MNWNDEFAPGRWAGGKTGTDSESGGTEAVAPATPEREKNTRVETWNLPEYLTRQIQADENPYAVDANFLG